MAQYNTPEEREARNQEAFEMFKAIAGGGSGVLSGGEGGLSNGPTPDPPEPPGPPDGPPDEGMFSGAKRLFGKFTGQLSKDYRKRAETVADVVKTGTGYLPEAVKEPVERFTKEFGKATPLNPDNLKAILDFLVGEAREVKEGGWGSLNPFPLRREMLIPFFPTLSRQVGDQYKAGTEGQSERYQKLLRGELGKGEIGATVKGALMEAVKPVGPLALPYLLGPPAWDRMKQMWEGDVAGGLGGVAGEYSIPVGSRLGASGLRRGAQKAVVKDVTRVGAGRPLSEAARTKIQAVAPEAVKVGGAALPQFGRLTRTAQVKAAREALGKKLDAVAEKALRKTMGKDRGKVPAIDAKFIDVRDRMLEMKKIIDDAPASMKPYAEMVYRPMIKDMGKAGYGGHVSFREFRRFRQTADDWLDDLGEYEIGKKTIQSLAGDGTKIKVKYYTNLANSLRDEINSLHPNIAKANSKYSTIKAIEGLLASVAGRTPADQSTWQVFMKGAASRYGPAGIGGAIGAKAGGPWGGAAGAVVGAGIGKVGGAILNPITRALSHPGWSGLSARLKNQLANAVESEIKLLPKKLGLDIGISMKKTLDALTAINIALGIESRSPTDMLRKIGEGLKKSMGKEGAPKPVSTRAKKAPPRPRFLPPPK